MSNGNSVTLVENVTRGTELRFTPNGQATASFGLAVNRRWQNRQTQEWEEVTSFFDVVRWREWRERERDAHAGAPGSSSPAGSSSEAGRPLKATRGPRWKWWPTSSGRAVLGDCASRKEREAWT